MAMLEVQTTRFLLWFAGNRRSDTLDAICPLNCNPTGDRISGLTPATMAGVFVICSSIDCQPACTADTTGNIASSLD